MTGYRDGLESSHRFILKNNIINGNYNDYVDKDGKYKKFEKMIDGLWKMNIDSMGLRNELLIPLYTAYTRLQAKHKIYETKIISITAIRSDQSMPIIRVQ